MAIARLSMKVGKTRKDAVHAAYIAREGIYAKRIDRGERLLASEYGNMPIWAEAEPNRFWRPCRKFKLCDKAVISGINIS